MARCGSEWASGNWATVKDENSREAQMERKNPNTNTFPSADHYVALTRCQLIIDRFFLLVARELDAFQT